MFRPGMVPMPPLGGPIATGNIVRPGMPLMGGMRPPGQTAAMGHV